MLIPEEITRHYMSVYPSADRHAKTFRNGRATADFEWPDWCYLPVAASYAIVSEEVANQGLSMSDAVVDIGNLAAVLSWRTTKGVYRFDPDLLASLWDVKLDKDLPTDVFFNLPEWCCYIDLADFQGAKEWGSLGFFVHLEQDANTREREIRITIVSPQALPSGVPGMATMPFHIDAGKTIADMLQGTMEYTQKHAPNTKFPQGLDSILQEDISDGGSAYMPFFSLIIYLCTADRDIIGPAKTRKIRKTRNPKKQKRQLPVEYRVGTSIGGAIRRARGTAKGTGAGAKKAPHIRKSHYHLYWTGKGRKTPIVKLIPPVPVNIGDEPVVPIVRVVK